MLGPWVTSSFLLASPVLPSYPNRFLTKLLPKDTKTAGFVLPMPSQTHSETLG